MFFSRFKFLTCDRVFSFLSTNLTPFFLRLKQKIELKKKKTKEKLLIKCVFTRPLKTRYTERQHMS